MNWKLYIDDLCDDLEVPNRHPPQDFIPARSSAEAIALTLQYGVPNFISFDHDLGLEDNSIIYIDWLIKYCYDHDVPEYQVHSANPVGRDNIISKMESWKKSKSL